MPKTYGNRSSVDRRFARWRENEVWEQLHQHFIDDPDMQHLLVDSTVVRAQLCAAIALKKDGGQAAQALVHNRGRCSTKSRSMWITLGNPLRFTLTGGQRHDITQAEALIAGYKGEFVLADKSYGVDYFRRAIRDSLPCL